MHVCIQTPGFSLALGLVVHGLSTSGHGKAEDIHPRLLAAWIKILLAEVYYSFIFFSVYSCICINPREQSTITSKEPVLC